MGPTLQTLWGAHLRLATVYFESVCWVTPQTCRLYLTCAANIIIFSLTLSCISYSRIVQTLINASSTWKRCFGGLGKTFWTAPSTGAVWTRTQCCRNYCFFKNENLNDTLRTQHEKRVLRIVQRLLSRSIRYIREYINTHISFPGWMGTMMYSTIISSSISLWSVLVNQILKNTSSAWCFIYLYFMTSNFCLEFLVVSGPVDLWSTSSWEYSFCVLSSPVVQLKAFTWCGSGKNAHRTAIYLQCVVL